MKRHCAANQTVIQLEKTLTHNTDAGAVQNWHYTTTLHIIKPKLSGRFQAVV